MYICTSERMRLWGLTCYTMWTLFKKMQVCPALLCLKERPFKKKLYKTFVYISEGYVLSFSSTRIFGKHVKLLLSCCRAFPLQQESSPPLSITMTFLQLHTKLRALNAKGEKDPIVTPTSKLIYGQHSLLLRRYLSADCCEHSIMTGSLGYSAVNKPERRTKTGCGI